MYGYRTFVIFHRKTGESLRIFCIYTPNLARFYNCASLWLKIRFCWGLINGTISCILCLEFVQNYRPNSMQISILQTRQRASGTNEFWLFPSWQTLPTKKLFFSTVRASSNVGGSVIASLTSTKPRYFACFLEIFFLFPIFLNLYEVWNAQAVGILLFHQHTRDFCARRMSPLPRQKTLTCPCLKS